MVPEQRHNHEVQKQAKDNEGLAADHQELAGNQAEETERLAAPELLELADNQVIDTDAPSNSSGDRKSYSRHRSAQQ